MTKQIFPLQLAWNKAVLYQKVGTIRARPAVDGEQINGETCAAGDLVNLDNPSRHYRIGASRIPGNYEVTATPGEYKIISEPRRVVFLEKSGHLRAPWTKHAGWDMQAGDPVIEIDKNGHREYMTQLDFKTVYQPFTPKPAGP